MLFFPLHPLCNFIPASTNGNVTQRYVEVGALLQPSTGTDNSHHSGDCKLVRVQKVTWKSKATCCKAKTLFWARGRSAESQKATIYIGGGSNYLYGFQHWLWIFISECGGWICPRKRPHSLYWWHVTLKALSSVNLSTWILGNHFF